jgi:hypothetical protein
LRVGLDDPPVDLGLQVGGEVALDGFAYDL